MGDVLDKYHLRVKHNAEGMPEGTKEAPLNTLDDALQNASSPLCKTACSSQQKVKKSWE